MTDPSPATRPAPRHPLLAALLLAVGVAGVWWALDALKDSPTAPYCSQALPRRGTEAALVALLCGTALTGALMGTGVRRGIRWVIALPILLTLSGAGAWFLVTYCTGGGLAPAGAGQRRAVWLALRFVSAWGAGLMYLVFGGGLAGGLLAGAGRGRGRGRLCVMLAVAAGAGMGATLLFGQGARSDVLRHLRAGHAGPLGAMALLMLIGACAAWVACAAAGSRPKALAAGLAGALLAAGPGWFLLHAALPKHTAEVLLAGPLAGKIGGMSLALRWCLLQWSATGLLAWGYAIVLSVLPDRGERSPSSPKDPPASTAFASLPGLPASETESEGKKATVPVLPPRPGRVYVLLALAFAAFVIYGSLVPLRYRPVPFSRAVRMFRGLHWLNVARMHRTDLAVNCMLGVILSYLAMGAVTRGGLRRWAGWLGAVIVPPAVLAVAATAEFLQIYFRGRTPTLNDIASQSGGAVIGVVLWLLTGPAVTRWAGGLWRRRVDDQTAVKVLAGYVVGLAAYQLWPFDLSPSPADIWHHYKAGRITLVPFADRIALTPYMLAIKTALLAPVGYMLWMAARRGRTWWALGGGLALAGGIELGQAMVTSRFASGTDIVLGVAGAALGALLASRLSPRAADAWPRREGWRGASRILLALALAGWACLLVRAEWSPFNFQQPREPVLSAIVRTLNVPLHHLYQHDALTAMAQASRRLGWFFVLGLLVRGLLGAGRGGQWATVAVVWLAAATVEVGQVFLPSRVSDLTTTGLIFGAGGTVGALLAPWLGRVLLASPLPPSGASG